MIHTVTTMNKDYYDSIGKIMIFTWLENFSNDYTLHLYLEDFSLDIDDPRIVIENWNNVKNNLDVWYSKNPSITDRHERFTKKALSQIEHWNKCSGKLLWLDADLIFRKPIDSSLFDKTIENYPLASWGKTQFESGTVFMNTEHPEFQKIKNSYEEIYHCKINLPANERWYDGELLGYACRINGSKHRDLNVLSNAKTSTPLNYSWLGEYMRHFKAKQKNNLRESLIKDYNRHDLAKMLDQ